MASGGAVSQDRVYRHTPTKHQVHFPARRTAVQSNNSKKSRMIRDLKTSKDKYIEEEDESESSKKRKLRQATLTQIDFVPRSTAEPVVEMSDSEDEKGAEDKENRRHDRDIWEVPDDDDDEDVAPIPSGRKRRVRPLRGTSDNKSKRRRTLGDGRKKVTKADFKREKGRRKTIGDEPDTPEKKPKGGYHTQTLTQLLGQRSFIKDSDDEDGDGEDGFEEWLKAAGEASPQQDNSFLPPSRPSPQESHRHKKPLKSAMKNTSSSPEKTDGENSVVVQTPAKKIHFEIPSSSQLTTPCTAMMERYGPVGAEADLTPSKKSQSQKSTGEMDLTGRKAISSKKVITDSCDTNSESSGISNKMQGRAPLERLATPVEDEKGEDDGEPEMETPTKAPKHPSPETLRRVGPVGLSPGSNQASSKKPMARTGSGRSEIPDSEDEEGFGFGTGVDVVEVKGSQEGYVAGADTQLVLAELANVDSDALFDPGDELVHTSVGPAEEPEDGEGKENVRPLSEWSTSPGTGSNRKTMADFTRGSRATSFLAPTHTGPLAANAENATHATRTPARAVFEAPSHPPARKPLHLPSETDPFTQPMESQRVPASILQSLPQPGARTDILIPVSHVDLQLLIRGYTTLFAIPSRALTSVCRFWLFESDTLRYVASVETEKAEPVPGEGTSRKDKLGKMSYPVSQVYELNNALTGNDLREDGLIPGGEVKTHKYLPPAVVSRYLWNLRHALFRNANGETETEPPDPPSSPVLALNRDKVQQQAPSASGRTIRSSPPLQGSKAKAPTPSISESQQIENQLQSESTHYHASDEVLVPSTPDEEEPDQTPREHLKERTRPLVAVSDRGTPGSLFGYQRIDRQASGGRLLPHPSQATTASQVSSSPSQLPYTPPRHSAVNLTLSQPIRADKPPGNRSRSRSTDHETSRDEEEPNTPKERGPPDSSIHFATYQDSPIPLPESVQLGSSQATGLLTKSQMLPDSLLRDEGYAAPR